LSSGIRRNPQCVAGGQRVLAPGRFGVGCVLAVAAGCPAAGIAYGVGLSGRFGWRRHRLWRALVINWAPAAPAG